MSEDDIKYTDGCNNQSYGPLLENFRKKTQALLIREE